MKIKQPVVRGKKINSATFYISAKDMVFLLGDWVWVHHSKVPRNQIRFSADMLKLHSFKAVRRHLRKHPEIADKVKVQFVI